MFILQFISGAYMSGSFYIVGIMFYHYNTIHFIHLFMDILIISSFGC